MKAFLIVITTLALALSMVAQVPGGVVDRATPPHPLLPAAITANWTIVLYPATADGPFGNATFSTYKDMATGVSHQRLSVECEYTEFPVGTMFDVFVTETASPTAAPRYVGNMEVRSGSAGMLVIAGAVPKVIHGSKITVLHNGVTVMAGIF